jgi:hypothetical protein
MIRRLQDSGCDAPIGALGHAEDVDVENVLQRNLQGLKRPIARD